MKQFHRLKHMLVSAIMVGAQWLSMDMTTPIADVRPPASRYEKGFNRTLPKVKQHQRMMKKRRARKAAKRRMRK